MEHQCKKSVLKIARERSKKILEEKLKKNVEDKEYKQDNKLETDKK